jgi:hypothetical protein
VLVDAGLMVTAQYLPRIAAICFRDDKSVIFTGVEGQDLRAIG